MSQIAIPAVVYRGGTSRGIFFHKKDLPDDAGQRARIFEHGIDSWNLSQVDGLGAGTSHTSKCVVIAPSQRPGVDIEYTFYQIGIGKRIADCTGTCGNLMAGSAAFAIDEGLVPVSPDQDSATVTVYDTNAAKTLVITVALENGLAKSAGDCYIPGIVRPGAPIGISILDPAGGKTGKALPLGPVIRVDTAWGEFHATVVDMINPFVFVAAEEVGLTGAEPFSVLAADEERLKTIDAIRDTAAVELGWARDAAEAREKSPAIPKVAVVAAPCDYAASSGAAIKASDVDIVVRGLSMSRLHRT
ncbi:MAG: PrpF protein, partial [Candidatus Accumulibacter sp.]|nr:PrpF protein [Accumulibacter sp.]